MEHDVSNHIEVPGPVDAVLHFASPASPATTSSTPIKTLKVGSLGTHNTLGLAKDKGARYFLASTSEVYGDPLEHPQKETYWGHVNPIGPRGVYDEAKRFAEAMTMAYHRSHGVDVRIVRIFNTYGEKMRPLDGRVVSNFIVQALAGKPLTVYGDGSQTRSFCYVDDEVRGLLALLDSDYVGPVNIGNPDEFTVLELAEIVLEVTGSSSEIVFEPLPVDDPAQRRPDITLAREVLGWEPTVDVRTGVGPHGQVVRPWLNTAPSRWWCPSTTSAPPSSRSCAACARSTCPSTSRSWSSTTAPTTAPRRCWVRWRTRRCASSTTRPTGARAPRSAPASSTRGDLLLIQDADLEYDPDDWPRLLTPVLKGKAQVVYGSRFTGERRNLLFWHWVGNRFLSLVTNVLYNTTLSDMETCYKLFDRHVLDGITIKSDRFEFEPEITAKVLRRGYHIYEVPISYSGRDRDEGKKITWTDGFAALATLVRYRFWKGD